VAALLFRPRARAPFVVTAALGSLSQPKQKGMGVPHQEEEDTDEIRDAAWCLEHVQ
jgi:hypothetical protein